MQLKFTLRSLWILFIWFIAIGCQKKVWLVSNHQSDYRIVIAPNAQAIEYTSAKLLQKYILQITDAELPITRNAGKKNIFIGFSSLPKNLLEKIDTTSFPNEKYIIRSNNNDLIIAGGGTRGTIYGVVGYLKDHLNCRWYTKEVQSIPKLADIPLPEKDDIQQPTFDYREPWYAEAYDSEWALLNRINPSIIPIPDSLGGSYITYPFAHTFYALVSPDLYFDKHPEYFALVKGKRQKHEAQLCLTNPEVVRIATETVLKWINDNPLANVISVDQNDGNGNCECDKCTTIDKKEASPAGSLLHFVNQVADNIYKVHPTKRIQTFAYHYTEVPPKTIRPAKNVTIRLCHYNYCNAHAIDQCEQHKPFRDNFEQWSKISDHISIWDYFTDFDHYLSPYPNFEAVKHNLKWYAERNTKGIFAQGNNVPSKGGGEFSALRAWVFAQLMWNPDLDGQKLIEEYVRNVYGAAAEQILTYITLIHNEVKKYPDNHFSIYTPPLEMSFLSPSLIKQADVLFQTALENSKNDAALYQRVQLAYLPILYTQLYFYKIGGYSYLPKTDFLTTVQMFENIIADNQIKVIGEVSDKTGSLDRFLNSVKSPINYFTEWWVVGPFSNTDSLGLKKKFEPEIKVDLNHPLQTIGSENRWKKHASNIGFIDFNELFTPNEFTVAYAYATLESNTARVAKFGVGSNDGVRVWINQKLVLDKQVSRRATPNEDLIEVPLQKGTNHILVKVDQHKRAWGFFFTEFLQ